MKRIFITLITLLGFFEINAQNHVGIGTSSPASSAILDVTSTNAGFLFPRMTYTQRTQIGSPVAGLMVYQTNSGGFPVQPTGIYFYDGGQWKRIARADEIGGGGGSTGWTVAGDDQYSNLNGNVGIGTTDPNSKFHLVGNFLHETGTYTMDYSGAIIQMQNAGVNKAFMQISGNNFRFGTNSGNSSGSVILRMNAQDRVTVDSTGKVGIGISNPETKLHVYGGTMKIDYPGSIAGLPFMPSLQFEISTEDEKRGGLRFVRNGSVLANLDYTADADGPNYIRLSGNNSSDRDLIVNSLGHVGINMNGTVFQPLAQLHVRAADQMDAIALHTAFNTQNPTIQFYNTSFVGGNANLKRGFVQLSDDTNLRLGTNSGNTGGNVIFRMNGTDRMLINPSGNVGIGTSNPLTKLDVAGKLRITQSGENIAIDGSDPQISFYRNGAFHSWIGQYADNMYIASNDVLRLDADQVAIGSINTNAPNYKLTVNGKIICTELKVEEYATWPDYVFSNTYQLRPLDELKSFIEINNHLPNIPKADDVAKSGFEVGEMNQKLLEKIEELTLYVIQLKEEIEALKSSSVNRQP